jgi:plastocyanin
MGIRVASTAAVLLLSVGFAAGQKPTGRLEGAVHFTGVVPPPEKIITSDGMVLMHSDLVVDAKSKGLRYVAVYLENAPARPLAKDAQPVVIDQRDMVFSPRVVAVQEGRTVRFDNNDLSNHAVQAMSTDTRNAFNVLTPMGQPFDFKFVAQKGPVHVGCPIHQWMRAWVYVLPDTKRRETKMVAVEAGKTARITVEMAGAEERRR